MAVNACVVEIKSKLGNKLSKLGRGKNYGTGELLRRSLCRHTVANLTHLAVDLRGNCRRVKLGKVVAFVKLNRLALEKAKKAPPDTASKSTNGMSLKHHEVGV